MTDSRIPAEVIRRCPDCGGEIVAAAFPSGTFADIDAAPVPNGQYVIVAWGIQYDRKHPQGRGPNLLLDYAMSDDVDENEPRYHAHLRTCPRRRVIIRRARQFQ